MFQSVVFHEEKSVLVFYSFGSDLSCRINSNSFNTNLLKGNIISNRRNLNRVYLAKVWITIKSRTLSIIIISICEKSELQLLGCNIFKGTRSLINFSSPFVPI